MNPPSHKATAREVGGGIGRWLVFSALWFLALLLATQFRWAWLCAGVGLLLGFLTDCGVDIFASKNHQRRMRQKYLDESGSQEAKNEPEAQPWTFWTRKRFSAEVGGQKPEARL